MELAAMVNTRRFLRIAGESLQGEAEVAIELQQPVVASMALELTVLLAGLTTSLRIAPSDGPAVVLTLVPGDRIAKAGVRFASDGAVNFALGKNQAEYLQATLLRAYCDEVAEVNHLHIEGDRDGTSFDLTIMFHAFRQPMSASAEEAALFFRD